MKPKFFYGWYIVAAGMILLFYNAASVLLWLECIRQSNRIHLRLDYGSIITGFILAWTGVWDSSIQSLVG